jgi:S-adenosylhomocysteine hydrolase
LLKEYYQDIFVKMKAEEQIIIEASQKAHQQLLEALIQINNLFEALKQYKLPDAAKASEEATTGVRRLSVRGHGSWPLQIRWVDS